MVNDMQLRFITEQLKALGGDVVNADAIARYLKDTMPTDGRATTGYLYEGNSPFGLVATDPISAVISGGSALMNWVPTRYINDRFEYVSHMSWVAPEGFDGSQTYPEFLQSIELDECAGGIATDWSGFLYQIEGGRFRWQTKMMQAYKDGGIKYYESQPVYSLRGSNIGQPLTSDREWAIARLMMVLQQHYEYVLRNGNRANSDMEWDGLDTILRPGYVQAHRVGAGVPTWANPESVNGVAVGDAEALLIALRVLIRRILKRIRMRNWALNYGDLVVALPGTMWDNLAEEVASGGMYKYTNAYGFDGRMDMSAYINEYNRVRTGGFGWGNITVDGTIIPIIADDSMGMNVTIDPGGTDTPGIAGDVYVLTRRVNGMTLLEQQFVDWTKLDYPTNGKENIVQLPQGHVRAGWVTEANSCFYYYSEMGGRIASYMQPLQGVIRNVVIPTLGEHENESGAFFSPDFYAYDGQGGGRGSSLLTAV